VNSYQLRRVSIIYARGKKKKKKRRGSFIGQERGEGGIRLLLRLPTKERGKNRNSGCKKAQEGEKDAVFIAEDVRGEKRKKK